MDKLLALVAIVYITISQIAALYFTVIMIKESESILFAIFVAPIFGEFKGLLWPFFI
jgi:hypothetical protein